MRWIVSFWLPCLSTTVEIYLFACLPLHDRGDHSFGLPPSPRPWRSPFWLASLSTTVEITLLARLRLHDRGDHPLASLSLQDRGDHPFGLPPSPRPWRSPFSLASLSTPVEITPLACHPLHDRADDHFALPPS